MHVLKDFTLAPDKVVGGMEKVKWGQRRVCKEKTFTALIVTGGSPESLPAGRSVAAGVSWTPGVDVRR